MDSTSYIKCIQNNVHVHVPDILVRDENEINKNEFIYELKRFWNIAFSWKFVHPWCIQKKPQIFLKYV